MQDLDRALARLYQQAPGVVPQHDQPRESRPTGPSKTSGPPPAPHFQIPRANTGVFDWPTTVRLLERDYGERFEQLASSLFEARDRMGFRVLLITSCHRAEGRSTLVLTTARALARRPGRTLLIDGDLTGPMLSRLLDLRPRVGLDDVVLHGEPIGKAIIESPDDHLFVLPLRSPVQRPREFLSSAGWSCLMAKLRREFDLVLIDGSPLFTGLSAAVLHPSVDAAVLVHHRRLTSERSLLQAREVLEAGGIPLLGLAETFVERE